MTKVWAPHITFICTFYDPLKLYATVAREYETPILRENPEELGYVNQHGLSRKVRCSHGLESIKLNYGVITTHQHIFEAIKHSLERLQLDYVDVLQCARALVSASSSYTYSRG
jgi:hypothetical protein